MSLTVRIPLPLYKFMNNQFSDKTGEPWAVNPRFLNLRPMIISLPNYTIKAGAGHLGTPEQVTAAYDLLLNFASDIVRMSNVKDGLAIPSVNIFCLNQCFKVTFEFYVKSGEIILPRREDAMKILGKRLRQLFN